MTTNHPNRTWWPLAALVAVLAAVPATTGAATRPASPSTEETPLPAGVAAEGLSEADWSVLLRRSVVVKGKTGGAGDPESARAVAFVVVDAPLETTYDFLGRHERRPDYSRCTKAVQIVARETRDGRDVVKARETHQALWITMRYTLEYVHDRARGEIRWALDPEARNDVRDNRGSWRMIELGPRRSLVVYRVSGIPGNIPRFLLDLFVRKDLPRYLTALRRYVEAEAVEAR